MNDKKHKGYLYWKKRLVEGRLVTFIRCVQLVHKGRDGSRVLRLEPRSPARWRILKNSINYTCRERQGGIRKAVKY